MSSATSLPPALAPHFVQVSVVRQLARAPELLLELEVGADLERRASELPVLQKPNPH